MTQLGKVYLVGAGLGNIAYLTVRAQQLLQTAEVLVYDALVDSQLLQLVPIHCLKFDVGKRGGQPSTPQAEINQIMVTQCAQNKRVVRLKSGDPFIFGRSHSEIQALIEARCPFEVVPGISSALAAPLLAGIPLTDPVLSRSFTVMTAHEIEQLNWETLSSLETLVILMGGRNIEEIIQRLQQHGRSPATPIAIIRWAGCPQQQIWTGTLDNIMAQTIGKSLSPAVIVVGEVVKLRDDLQSFDSPALQGKTVLVTRSAGQSSQFSDRLQQEGANVVEMPALEITPPSSWDDLDNAIAHLSTYAWLILTSTNAVDYFFERLQKQGLDARALSGVKIAVVGKKTAESLQKRALTPDFIPPNFVADSLIEHFPESFSNLKILFPRVESGGREVLVKELTAKGAVIAEVAAYQSACPVEIAPAAKEALQQRSIDIITFASSKTVKHFYKLLEPAFPEIPSLLQDVCIASIGPQTSETCRELLGRVDVEAAEYTLDGLTSAIAHYFHQKISLPNTSS